MTSADSISSAIGSIIELRILDRWTFMPLTAPQTGLEGGGPGAEADPDAEAAEAAEAVALGVVLE